MSVTRNWLVLFSLKQLINFGAHLGLQSTLLHSAMVRYSLPFRGIGFSILNLRFTLYNVKSFIYLAIDLMTKRGLALLINSVASLDPFLTTYFSSVDHPVSKGLWVPGRLTNFRSVRSQSIRAYYLHRVIIQMYLKSERVGHVNMRVRNLINRAFNPIKYKQAISRHVVNLISMPKSCIILDGVLNNVAVRETYILKIPALTLVDSGSNLDHITYVAPSNSTSVRTTLFFCALFKRVLLQGRYKERFLFLSSAWRSKKQMYSYYARSLFNDRSTALKHLIKLDRFPQYMRQLDAILNVLKERAKVPAILLSSSLYSISTSLRLTIWRIFRFFENKIIKAKNFFNWNYLMLEKAAYTSSISSIIPLYVNDLYVINNGHKVLSKKNLTHREVVFALTIKQHIVTLLKKRNGVFRYGFNFVKINSLYVASENALLKKSICLML